MSQTTEDQLHEGEHTLWCSGHPHFGLCRRGRATGTESTDVRRELTSLVLGRTTTNAVERILAAGYVKSETVIHVHHHDIENHARSFNEGYETAISQKLSDDPTAAEDWLNEKLAQAFAYGWREGKGIPTPVDVDTGDLLHDQAQQPEFNPYRLPEQDLEPIPEILERFATLPQYDEPTDKEDR